jgi:hypothetical protein
VQQLPRDGVDDAESAPPAEILDAWFEDDDGARIAESRCGTGCRACIEVRFNETMSDPVFGVTLRSEWGMTVFATTTAVGHGATGRFTAGRVAVIRLRFENWLTDSVYTLTPSIAPGEDGAAAFDLRENAASIVIHGGPGTGGIAHLPHTFDID